MTIIFAKAVQFVGSNGRNAYDDAILAY